MSIEIMGLISFVAFLLAAFFAGAETAILISDPVRLRHLQEKGDRRAKLLLGYKDNPEYFLSVVLVGTNLGVVGCTSAFTAVMITFYGDAGATAATIILVPTLMVFQEIIPKGIFLYYADTAAILSIYPLRLFAAALYPIIITFSGFTNLIVRLFGADKPPRPARMSMEELLFHLRDSRDAGIISAETMALAARAQEWIRFSVRDVMLPLERVVMVPDGLRTAEYQKVFARERFTRVPVYRTSRQDVAGILSIHNLLKARRPREEGVDLETPYVVDVDTPIVSVLIQMKDQGSHMAIVKERSGKIVGITTLEDILERLVGAIVDEFH